MCGICGIIRFDGSEVEESAVRKMMQVIKHRGPDDEGVFIEGNVGLGFVRLSIIDLSPAGHQPMLGGDEDRYVMIFNGEIYNYVELRDELTGLGHIFKTKTDSEVLLRSYIEWGENCMHRFNGMWAFVIYDRMAKSFFGSRDRYGVKPFYYFMDEHKIIFASEIQAILSQLDLDPEADDQTVFDYLVYNRTDQTEKTFFKGINKLQHGWGFKIGNSDLKLFKWYDLRERVTKSRGFQTAKEFRELFSSAVGLRLRSDVPVGVCFSGGLDSSSIVSVLLNDFGKKDLNTFSAVYENGHSEDESEFINEYNDCIDNMYFTTPNAITLEDDLISFVKAHGEPIPTTSPYAQFKVMELAKQNVTVTLDGQGADEELAGYHYFFGFFFKDLLKSFMPGKLSIEIFQYLIKHRSIYGLKTFIYFLLPEKLRTWARVAEKGYVDKEFVKRHSSSNSVSGNIYGSETLNEALLDHFEFKLEHLLKWEDRNSMHFSLEARVPFLDYRLVEKILSTSSDKVIKSGMTKHILREAMKGTMPEKIRMRRDKMGFETPQDKWFRTPQWQKIIEEVLNSHELMECGYIDVKIAKEIYQQHLSGKNFSREIWKWIHLAYWLKEFKIVKRKVAS